MNYKNKLEEYLNNKKDNDMTKSFIRTEIDESLIYSITNNSAINLKNSIQQNKNNNFAESLGIELNNYKRVVENCLNTDTIENKNKNYNLKNFLPRYETDSKIIKKYEHLLPQDKININKLIDVKNQCDDDIKVKINEYNSPMKLEELENNRKINTKNYKNKNKNSKIFFNILIEKVENNKSEDFIYSNISDIDDDSNQLNEIQNLNKELKNKNKNSKIKENEGEYEWHCLDYTNYDNLNDLVDKIEKFYNFEI